MTSLTFFGLNFEQFGAIDKKPPQKNPAWPILPRKYHKTQKLLDSFVNIWIFCQFSLFVAWTITCVSLTLCVSTRDYNPITINIANGILYSIESLIVHEFYCSRGKQVDTDMYISICLKDVRFHKWPSQESTLDETADFVGKMRE